MGDHYLVDAKGNLMKLKETGDTSEFVPNRDSRLLAYYTINDKS